MTIVDPLSLAAYRNRSSQNEQRIVDCLAQYPEGLTCDEVEVDTGMSHQSASATIKKLRDEKIVKRTGERRPTRTGNLAWGIALA